MHEINNKGVALEHITYLQQITGQLSLMFIEKAVSSPLYANLLFKNYTSSEENNSFVKCENFSASINNVTCIWLILTWWSCGTTFESLRKISENKCIYVDIEKAEMYRLS